MASKVSALIESTTIAATDWFYSVVGGASRKVKAENVFASLTGSKLLISYASLSAAVTAIGSSQATLWITSSTTVSSSFTVPSNITVIFMGTGIISVNSGQTLTLNTGSPGWPLRQVFTGAGSVRFGGGIAESCPEWFGAAMDGTTDDQAALQKAIDAFTGSGSGVFRAATVKITGGLAIGSSATIGISGVIIDGPGWGISSETLKRGFIKWIGSAGSPMILISDVVASGVKNIRLIGKTSAKPSAAIELRQTGGGGTLDQSILENLWIGSYYTTDTDQGVQFSTGILFTGSVNSDTGIFKNINIQQCTTGVDIQNPNATVAHWDTLQIGLCVTGFKTVGPHNLVSNFLCYANDVDMEVASQGHDWLIHNYVSEGSGRMLVVNAASPFRFTVIGGSFQAIDAANGGKFTGNDQTSPNRRWMVDARNAAGGNGAWIELKSFNLTQAGTPPIPVVLAWGTNDGATASAGTGVVLILDGVRGFTSQNFNVGTDNTYNSSRVVIFNRQSANAAVAPQFNRYIFEPTDSEDQAYQDLRFDIAGKETIYGGPVKVKRLPTPNGVSVVATGGTGTTYGYRVSALTRDGETLASSTVTVSGGATLSISVYNTVSFNPVVGAYAYRVYGRTSGSELLLKTLTLADIGDTFQAGWRDDGSLTPSGALPTSNTTGNLYVGGQASVTPGDTVQDALRVNHSDGTPRVQAGVYEGAPSYAGMWFGSLTPASDNYGFLSNGGLQTILNVPDPSGSLIFRAAHANTS